MSIVHPLAAGAVDDSSPNSSERADLAENEPLLAAALEGALDELYSAISADPALERHFVDAKQKTRARTAQAAYWRTLISGNNDIQQAERVGAAHARVGIDHRAYLRGYAVVLDHLLRAAAARAAADAHDLEVVRETIGRISGALVRCALRDMSEVMSAYLRAKENENAERSRLYGSLARDLCTPIDAVIGYSELVLEDLAPGDRVSTDVNQVIGAARRLRRTVEGLVALSRIHSGAVLLSLESVDATAVARSVVEAMREELERNHNRVVEPAQAGPTVTTDPDKLAKCLSILLGNAARFTSDGAIELRVIRRSTKHGDVIVFEVIDTGIGMHTEDIERLFDPQLASESGMKGSAVGLSVVRGFAHLMGGTLSIESTKGLGTMAGLAIPAGAAA